MGAYSFLNTNVTLAGPGGVLSLGAGAAVAEEGISLEPVEDKNVMTIGADGKGQHSLIASDAAKATIRILKTSPLNQALMIMYDAQSLSSALWGINVLTISDPARGDYHVGTGVAFKKKPAITQAKEAGFNEWELDIISCTSILGSS